MAETVLVSARIPLAKKDASKGILASLGANTSDLINSAFDYLLNTKTLPESSVQCSPSKEEIASFLATSSLAIDWKGDAADGDYTALLEEGKRARYESLD